MDVALYSDSKAFSIKFICIDDVQQYPGEEKASKTVLMGIANWNIYIGISSHLYSIFWNLNTYKIE